MDLSTLPTPTAEHFQQSFGSPPEKSLYITRGFLKAKFERDPIGQTKKKQSYIQELITLIENKEIAFRQLMVSNETLTEVAISLHRDYTEKEAEECLQEVLSNDVFNVIQTTEERFNEAATHFKDTESKTPNFAEFIDYQVLCDEDISHVATWDTDFTYFGEITMLPNVRWGT